MPNHLLARELEEGQYPPSGSTIWQPSEIM